MKWPYRCKDCGAYLDPGETCDCKKADEREQQEENDEEND